MDKDAAISVTGADGDRKEFMQQWLDSNESTSVDFAGTGAGERAIDREEGFASRFYSTCLREFQQLCRKKQEGYAHGSRSYLLKEELDKFYMWGESFGPGELDKALDESEELRDNVLDLLVNLGDLLICELRASSTVTRAGQIHEFESFIKQARLIMSDVDGQVDLDALASDTTCLDRDDYSDDNVHDFCEDVVFIIKCLMELGPSLEQNLTSTRRPAPSIPKSASVLFCLSGPAEFYVSLVREKFKQASRELVERLGEANWQRHLKVRNMSNDAENIPTKGQPTARSVFQPDMTFYDSGIGTSVPAGTPYAPSDTSFQTSNTEGALRSLRVPPTPLEASKGQSFRCHLCGDMISTVRTRTQWKMHVFSDLMPYICTFDRCPNKLRCFPSRSAWANHEFQEHRFDRYWACPECPEKSCSTLDWEHHLNSVHSQKFSGPNLVSARNTACRISPKHAEEEECPLCRVVLGEPRRAFVKHVSRHMEDIALMALPGSAEVDSGIGLMSTARAAIKRRVSGRVEFSPVTLLMQPNGQHYDAAAEKPTARIMSPYDTTDGLIGESPQVERTLVNAQPSPSPEYLPPPDRYPTPERRERRRRPKAQATQGDAVLIGFMGGLNRSDLASKAGEEPLPQDSEESTDDDDEEPTNRESGETIKLARNAVSIVERCDARRDNQHSTSNDEQSESGSDSNQLLPFERESSLTDHLHGQYGPSSNENTEAPHLKTLSSSDQYVKRGFSVDGDLQVLDPQERVKRRTKRSKRRFTFAEKAEIAARRRTGALYTRRSIESRIPYLTHTIAHPSVDNPLEGSASSLLQQSHQMTKSTSGFFEDFLLDTSSENINEHDGEPLDICPSQDVVGKAIKDRSPSAPQLQSVDRTLPSTRKGNLELFHSSWEEISGVEERLSRSKSNAWQLAYGKSLEAALGSSDGEGGGWEIPGRRPGC